jgi:predicted phosphoribosyltransferase
MNRATDALSSAPPIFEDRRAAGRALAVVLDRYRPDHPVVLGLPRGGVVVAAEVARALGAPLGALVVRKLGVPGAEEYAFGAVGPGGMIVLNEAIARTVPERERARVIAHERGELARRERLLADRSPLAIEDRVVLLIDDGLATGATMRAAVRVIRTMKPAQVEVAVPVAAGDALATLRRETDAIVALATPEPFVAVGQWYVEFEQVGDAEVLALLGAIDAQVSAAARRRTSHTRRAAGRAGPVRRRS